MLAKKWGKKKGKVRDVDIESETIIDCDLKFMTTGSACTKSTYLLELDSMRTYANAV